MKIFKGQDKHEFDNTKSIISLPPFFSVSLCLQNLKPHSQAAVAWI